MKENLIFETKRLKFLYTDIKEAELYYKEFNEEVTTYQYADPFKSIEDAKNFIEYMITLREVSSAIMISILDKTNNFIGGLEVYNLDGEIPEIGVWICNKYWNRGYGYESLKAILNYLSIKYKVKKVIYEVDTRNESSINLINKFDLKKQEHKKVINDSGKVLELDMYIVTIK